MAKRSKTLVGLDIDATGIVAASVVVNGRVRIERAAFAPLDLAHVLADAAEIYEATAEARGQRLETDLPERLALVGDRGGHRGGGGR